MQERKPKKPLKINLALPVNSKDFNLDPTSCFGLLYNPAAVACNSLCGRAELCAGQQNKYTAKQKAAIAAAIDFIDATNFDAVKWQQLLAAIKQHPARFSMTEFVEIIRQQSSCPDIRTVQLRADKFLLQSNIAPDENGMLTCKEQ